MSTNNNDKTCANCKYFERHYLKTDTGFKSLLYGVCRHRIPYSKRLQQTATHVYKTCEFWCCINKAEKKQNILDALQKMSVQLEELAILLKNDF